MKLFHQNHKGLEVIAGNIFNCEEYVFKPWEFQFNATSQQQPIRNIAIPYFFYGLPLAFLKFLNMLLTVRDYSLFTNKLDTTLTVMPIQANTLIYYPRIFMTLCSLIIDFTILKSAELFGLDGLSVLITFATSYTATVYLTRTFSNTIETLLFSVLIFLVIKSIKSQHVLNDKFLIATEPGKHPISTLINSTSDLINSTFLNEETASTPVKLSPKREATLKRLRMFDIFKYDYLASWIGLVVCLGFFNRPTFIFYAIVPLAYWTLYGLDSANTLRQFVYFFSRRLLALTRLAVPCLILLVFIDTVYYHQLNTIDQFVRLIFKRDRPFIITPFNFFVYNSNPDNLNTHGKHPLYLHALVNCILLFGLNHFLLYFIFFNLATQLFKSMRQSTNFKLSIFKLYQLIMNNRFCYLLFSYLVPLFLFSLVSHQEPRFLLPLIIPICLLTGHCIFGKNSYMLFRVIWICFNLLAFVFYGYVHQGGVIASLNYVQKMYTHPSNLEMDQHVVYYNTYMPPRFLVQVPVHANIVKNKLFVYEKNKKRFEAAQEEGNFQAKFRSDEFVLAPVRKIHDLMSVSMESMKQFMLEIKMNSTSSKTKFESKKRITRNLAIFLVVPSIVDAQLDLNNEYETCSGSSGAEKAIVKFQLQTQFKLHFSGEHLNEQLNLVSCRYSSVKDLVKRKCLEKRCLSTGLFERVLNAFSLNFYQVIL